MNALLEKSTLDYGAIDFTKFSEKDFLPALESAISEAQKNVEKIKQTNTPNFDNIIVALEEASSRIDLVSEVFYVLYSAHCTNELSKISEDFSEKITKFGNDLTLDHDLFEKVKTIYEKRKDLDLNTEQLTVLEETYLDFVRNGALLSETDKEKLRKIDDKLSKLSLKFAENVRNGTNDYVLLIDNKDDLKGMPDSIVQAAKATAKEKGTKIFGVLL